MPSRPLSPVPHLSPDPFGRPHARLPGGVELAVAEDGSRFILRARRALAGIATGRFSRPSASIRFDPVDLADDAELLGFACTQFALPVVAGPELDFDFRPAANLQAPRAMSPLLVRWGSGCALLAPVDHPHEQIITIDEGALVWGWHGDLDEVPADFATTVGVFRGETPSEVFDAWGAEVRRRAPVRRRRLDEHPLTSHLSYWTDNGAAYWYRTETGRTIAESVADTVRALHDVDHVAIGAVELDSWWYDHAVNRPISTIGYLDDVPPTGTHRWEPRADAFPPTDGGDRLLEFARSVEQRPLVLHARHIAASSPYVAEGLAAGASWWVDGRAAQPTDPSFFRRWFDDAARWGACCIEQDWMLMFWFGVRSLRSAPGRAAAWQQALDRHAGETGIGLLWCMATPADLVVAAGLEHVIAVRTSDDYRFADDPARLWIWFLTVNRLATTLALPVFKDCFFSNPSVGEGDDSIDGDPYAEIEGLLAAFSAGPIGIGDRLGRTDRAMVMRTCDDDGALRHPDHPIGLIDDCLFGAPRRGDRLAWATTTSTVDGAVWTYIVAINVADDHREITDALELAVLRVDPSSVVYDWRKRQVLTDRASIEVRLAARDWALYVCCPSDTDGPRLGDVDKYVTMPARPPRRSEFRFSSGARRDRRGG